MGELVTYNFALAVVAKSDADDAEVNKAKRLID
jgi:hypothetical protein